MNIKDLRNNIINLNDFFRHASYELKKKTGFLSVTFLVPNGKNGDFITKYSTCGSCIRLTRKDLCHLNENFQEGILYPKTIVKRCGFLSRMFIKIHWIMRMRNASAIMPIYRDRKIACLILFFDRLANDWLSKHGHCVDALQREIAYCLEVILLYNQTLERIIREYDRSKIRPANHATPIPDEPTPVLIGKKVEFS